MGQLVAFLQEVREFAGDGGGLVELVALEADQRQLPTPAIGARRRDRPGVSAGRAESWPLPDKRRGLVEIAERIEHPELLGGIEQKLACPLAVNVDEDARELLDGGERHRLIVGVRGRAALPGQSTDEDQLVVLDRHREKFADPLGDALLRQLESAGHAQFVGSRANEVGGAAFAEEEAKGLQEKRLAGPGLAGPDAVAGFELDCAGPRSGPGFGR